MKSFKNHKQDIEARDRLMKDIFDFDDTEIQFSEEFKEKIKDIFDKAVQARIENDYEIIGDDEPERKPLKETYIQDLVGRI